MPEAIVESLDHEGRGVAHVDGKAIFIEGALPGECVDYASYRRKASYEQARVVSIRRASSQRVVPPCPHFGVCGGCSVQHLEFGAQTAVKQRVLEDALWHIGRLKPELVFPPIVGQAWGYRHRARLAVAWDSRQASALVGFHKRRSNDVADMLSCKVLPPAIAALLPGLRELVASMSIRDRLSEIELVAAESQTALLLRILKPLQSADKDILRSFADANGIVLYLQQGGPDAVALFHPADAGALEYELPDFGVRLRFLPQDFTQVNFGINRMLVRRAMALLAPVAGEHIADMFCGLGNFTLPIASHRATVVGVEGIPALVERARANATVNGLEGLVRFHVANLFEATAQSLAALGPFDKMLIDPPREGAMALVRALVAPYPQRIVYVSCNPATLARDAAILVNEQGYRLRGAGIGNMFPQTSHVESIALFER